MADRRQRCLAVAVLAAAVLTLPASASATGFWSDPSGADLVANAAPPVGEAVRVPAAGPAARRARCALRQRRRARSGRRCGRRRVAPERLGSRGLETGNQVAPAALEVYEPFRREGLVPR